MTNHGGRAVRCISNCPLCAWRCSGVYLLLQHLLQEQIVLMLWNTAALAASGG